MALARCHGAGYIYGAIYARMHNYRIDGEDKITLEEDAARMDCYHISKAWSVPLSRLPIPVIGSVARGTQRLNCSMRGSMERALNNSAVECRVLWNQLPELVKDYPRATENSKIW